MRYYRLLLVFAIAFSACQDDFQSADLPNRDKNVYEDVPVKLIVRGILKAVGMIFNIQIDNEDTYIIRSTE